MSFLLALFALYWLPTIIAVARHTNSALGVAFVNFFGFTVIGWFLALIWALAASPSGQVVYVERHW